MCVYVYPDQVEQMARIGDIDRTTIDDVDQLTADHVRGVVWNHKHGRWERRWMARAMTPAFAKGCKWVIEPGAEPPKRKRTHVTIRGVIRANAHARRRAA
jgi:hypothetical protein